LKNNLIKLIKYLLKKVCKNIKNYFSKFKRVFDKTFSKSLKYAKIKNYFFKKSMQKYKKIKIKDFLFSKRINNFDKTFQSETSNSLKEFLIKLFLKV